MTATATTKEPAATQQPQDADAAVVITGYSLRAPNCSSVPDFMHALQHGHDLTTSNFHGRARAEGIKVGRVVGLVIHGHELFIGLEFEQVIHFAKAF